MARLSLAATVTLVLAAVPGGLAGPACTRRQWASVDDCIQQCSTKWGWPGHAFGSDPWGQVVNSGTSVDPASVVASACSAQVSGTAASSSIVQSTQTAAQNTIVNVQTSPSATIALASTSLAAPPSSVVSSRFVTVVRSSSLSSVTLSASSASVTHAGSLGSFSASVKSGTRTTNNAILSTSSTAVPSFSSSAALQAPVATTTISSSTPAPPKTSATPSPPPSPTTSTSRTSLPPPKMTSTPPPPPKITSTPPPAQTTTASSSSGGNGGGSGGGTVSAADQQAYLNAHNSVRAQHGASPLSWDNTLEAAAQKWANNCVFEHSGGKLGPFGENLAAGTGNGYTIASAVKSWTDEVSQYNANNPVPSHFTQVVWKATTKVGCAVAQCSGIFSADFGLAHFHVCEYQVQGNVIGEFGQQVQA